jgi:hypothetical protein
VKALGFVCLLMLGKALPLHGQDLDAADVHVTLDSAVRLARQAAAAAFPDLSSYLLYSVTPRVLKGDAAGPTGRYDGRNGPSPTAGGWWSGSI